MKKIRRKTESVAVADFTPENEWLGATIVEDKPTTASRLLVVWLCASAILATLVYGMVDAWAQALFVAGAGVTGWLWLWDAWQKNELRISRNWLPVPILGLILIGLVQLLPLRNVILPADLLAQPASSAYSLDAFATRLAVVQLGAMLIYFAAALSFVNTQKRLRNVALSFVFFGFALAVFGIIQFFSGEGKIYWLRESPQATPFGPFVNRHHFGALMEMTIALTVGLIYTGAVGKEKRPIYIFAVVMMGVALILTSSRGALLSLVLILIFLTAAAILQRGRKSGRRDEERNGAAGGRLALVGGSLALIFVIFGAVLFLGGESFLGRSLGATGGAGDVSSGRAEFWRNSLEIVRDNPIFGVGLDAFAAAYTRYDTSGGLFRLERAHNDYLQMLAETGAFGLVCVFAFIILLFRRGLQIFSATQDRFRRGAAIGALAGCFGVIIHSFFDFPLRTPSNFLVFLIFAALATVHINHPKLYRRRQKAGAEGRREK